MPNTREKLIELITDKENDLIREIVWFTDTYRIKEVADHLVSHGVTIPTRCEHCQCSDTISCPAGRVWCSRMMRYMKLDGFCSEGIPKGDDNG